MTAKKRSAFRSWVVILVVLAGVGAGGYGYRDLVRGTKIGDWLGLKAAGQAKEVYYCPMHPDYQANKPGECPICNMALVKLPPEPQSGAEQKQTALPEDKPKEGKKVLYWQDPMNPSHRSDQPGKAPDGMDLAPVYAEETTAASLPPGTVRITPQKQQLIGVQIGEVKVEPLTRTLYTVGQITFDETRVSRIQTKVEGWIEQVFVNFSGKWVKKNQPLISIYSPDLVSTQQELLIARRALDTLGDSAIQEIAANARSLYESTRQRLRLWDISEAQIREIVKHGTPIKTLTLASPLEGFVISRNAYPGQRVTPDVELYTIADLSTIWVLADIFEYEVPMIRLGQHASMTFPYFPGQTYHGTVSYIYPQMDNQTRSLKVRLEFANPDFKIKPDMYATVELSIDYGRQLAVPDTAVLDSGTEQIVFVALADGYFEPRKVQLGARVNNNFIVLGGLKAGERVVTSANFLIDSESQLKAAMTGMEGLGPAAHGVAAPAESASPAPAALPEQTPAAGPMNHTQKPMPGMNHSQHTAPGLDHSQHQAKPKGSNHQGHDPTRREKP